MTLWPAVTSRLGRRRPLARTASALSCGTPRPFAYLTPRLNCSATCCGGSGRCRCQEADARPERNAVRLAKTGHTCGAVSEKSPESRDSSRSDVSAG